VDRSLIYGSTRPDSRHEIVSGANDAWGDAEACQPFCHWLNEMHPDIVSLTMYPKKTNAEEIIHLWRANYQKRCDIDINPCGHSCLANEKEWGVE
jgi:hypothetical protein